jgi:hypothetical protein
VKAIMKYTKSFKKYTDEYRPEVVDFVREWAREVGPEAVHEDNSLIKVTGTEEQIDALLTMLMERFSYVPPEKLEDSDGKKK